MTPPLLADFLDYLQTIRGSSESTRKEYGYDLSHMLRFLLARKQNINADENPEALNKCTERFHRTITLRDLHAFLAYLDREKQNAASSRTRKISAMRTYFSYLTDTIQILDKNPADGLESPRLQKDTRCISHWMKVNDYSHKSIRQKTTSSAHATMQ